MNAGLGGSSMCIVRDSDCGPTSRACKLRFVFNSIVHLSVTWLTLTGLVPVYTAPCIRNTCASRSRCEA